MRRTIVMFMIGCAIPILVVGCGGGGDASSDGGEVVAQNEGGGSSSGGSPGAGGGSAPGGPGGMGGGMGGAGGGVDMGGGDMGAGGAFTEIPGGGDMGDADMGAGGVFTGAPGGASPGAGYASGAPGAGGEGYGPREGQDGEADLDGEGGGAFGAAGIGAPSFGAQGIGGYGGQGVPGSFGPAGRGGGRAAPPSGFDGAARVAFQAGRETEAFQYLYAHALSSAKGGADLLTSIQWVKGLKRPALAVRFGAGVSLKSPPNVTDVKAIGTTQKLPERRSRGGQRGGGEGIGGAIGGIGEGGIGGGEGSLGGIGGFGGGGGRAQSGDLITKYAGDLGSALVKEFATRVNRGAFGAVLKDAPKAGGGRGRGQGGYGGGGAGFASGADGAAGLDGDFGDPGGAGAGLAGGLGFGGGEEGGFAGGQAAASASTRGITMLGVGPERELVKKAKEQGVDVMVLFDVTVKVNTKTGLVNNDTKVILIDVAKRARLHTGRPLNNFKVQNARSASKEDGISKEIDKMFEFIDNNLTMGPPPSQLTSAHITARVANLVSSKPIDPLPVLTEIRFWHRRNLLDDDALTAAFSQMLSPEIGEQLATGTEDERKAIVKRWLPAGG